MAEINNLFDPKMLEELKQLKNLTKTSAKNISKIFDELKKLDSELSKASITTEQYNKSKKILNESLKNSIKLAKELDNTRGKLADSTKKGTEADKQAAKEAKAAAAAEAKLKATIDGSRDAIIQSTAATKKATQEKQLQAQVDKSAADSIFEVA